MTVLFCIVAFIWVKQIIKKKDLVQFNGDRSEYELAVALKKATEIGGIQSNWLEKNVQEKKNFHGWIVHGKINNMHLEDK